MPNLALCMTEGELSQLNPQELKEYHETQRRTVFGHNARRGRGGVYLEQGIGAPGHETSNHWNAMRKREQMGQEEKGTTDRLMAEAAKRNKKA